MKRNYGGTARPWSIGRSALIAAEDTQVRRYAAEALARTGYTADVYPDTEKMLADLKSAGYSFLIMQGGTTGTDIMHRLRKRVGDIPIIVLSIGPVEQECSLSLGDSSVERLSAPFTLKMLQFAIAKVLGTYERKAGASEKL